MHLPTLAGLSILSGKSTITIQVTACTSETQLELGIGIYKSVAVHRVEQFVHIRGNQAIEKNSCTSTNSYYAVSVCGNDSTKAWELTGC